MGVMYCTYTLHAQNINVTSFCVNKTDSMAVVKPRYDINGSVGAIVKISQQNLPHLILKGNVIGNTINEDTVIIVYVLNNTKRLQLFHEGYIPKTIEFTELLDGCDGLKGGMVYHVQVCGTPQADIVATEIGARVLFFASNTKITKLKVNGKEWKIVNNTSSKLVPYGQYEYEAYTDGFSPQKGLVSVTPSFGRMTVNIEFK